MDNGDAQPRTQKYTTLIQQSAPKVVNIMVSWQVRVHNCPLRFGFFFISVTLVLFYLCKKDLLKFDFNLK